MVHFDETLQSFALMLVIRCNILVGRILLGGRHDLEICAEFLAPTGRGCSSSGGTLFFGGCKWNVIMMRRVIIIILVLRGTHILPRIMMIPLLIMITFHL